jgi:hypothetical protein
MAPVLFQATHSDRVASALQLFGDALRRRQDVVRLIQWLLVAIYLLLLVMPVMAPLQEHARVFNSIGRFAEALFWGIWWPSVILGTMIFGQFWCGLLCPDGTINEFVSHYGKGWKMPAWLRWPLLPLTGFFLLTLYSHLIDAHRQARGTLLVVGGMSVLAVLTGLLYGRGKRMLCRYLCPASSIFSLLARCSVLHFRVNRQVWDAASRPAPGPVDCPVLIDVRRLTSNEKCNMCGRCSGHRNAVKLAARPPGSEIETLRDEDIRRWETIGIAFGLIGLTYGVMHWDGSIWNEQLQLAFAGWFGDTAWTKAAAPWWLFDNADKGRVSWQSGFATLSAILLATSVLGLAICVSLYVATLGNLQRSCTLAYALIPLGGLGLFAGALEHSLAILSVEGWQVASSLPWIRAIVLLAAFGWSLRIGWIALAREASPRTGRWVSFLVFAALTILLALAYQLAPTTLLR